MKRAPQSPKDEFSHQAAEKLRLLLAGSPKEANRAFHRMIAALRLMLTLPDGGKQALSELTQHENPAVRMSASTQLLRFDATSATKVLREIEQGDYPWQLRADAEGVLSEWKKGTLELDWFMNKT